MRGHRGGGLRRVVLRSASRMARLLAEGSAHPRDSRVRNRARVAFSRHSCRRTGLIQLPQHGIRAAFHDQTMKASGLPRRG